MLTIKQWQTPTQYTITTKYTKTNTLPCFKCTKVSSEAIKGVHHQLYTGLAQTFCIHCWDSEIWECSHCNEIPSDEDCISCWKCGQWSHKNCNVLKIEAKEDFVCNMCKYAGDIIDVLSFQKTACVTKLEVTSNEFAEKSTQFASKHQKNNLNFQKQLNKIQTDLVEKQKVLRTYKCTLVEEKKKVSQLEEEKKKVSQLEVQKDRQLVWQTKKMKSMRTALNARSETVKHMKCMSTEKNNAIRALSAVKSRYNSANQEISLLKKQVKELEKQVSRATKDVHKNNKRGRECEHMLEDMQRLVKKYRARWNHTPPTKLSDVDQMLWKTYQCKTDGSCFSADAIKLKSSDAPPLWDSLGQTLNAIKNYHITTMQNKE
jgi:myosin heavy subunit